MKLSTEEEELLSGRIEFLFVTFTGGWLGGSCSITITHLIDLSKAHDN